MGTLVTIVQESAIQMQSAFGSCNRFVNYIDQELPLIKEYITCLWRFTAWLLGNLIQRPQCANNLA